MKKNKKMIVILSSIVVVALAATGIIFAVKKTTGKIVTVIPVSDINWGYWGSDVNISGVVTSNASQEVHLNDKQVIEEVFVQEGDTVEIGTPLLSFDMTMTNFNLESELLNKEGLEIQKKGLENEISRLKKETPISESARAGGNISASYSSGKDYYAGFITVSNADGTAGQTPVIPDATTTPTETPEPTETPTPEPTVIPEPTGIPSVDIPAYDCIDENSQYLGEGTKTNPRSYLAAYSEDYTARVTGSFLNQAKASGLCFYIGIRQDDVNGGELIASIFINGSRLGDYENDKIYLVTLYSEDSIVEEPTDIPAEEEVSIPEGYTQEELNAMIKEKQQELRTLNLDIRECDLRIAEIEKSLNDQQVTSTVNGVVKSVGDPEKGEINGQAFLVVESTEGLYVQGSISELMLEDIQVGHMLMGMSWESGMSFEAEICEISTYPLDGNNYDGYGNSNASYYPFVAYIENGEGLHNNEYVSFTTTVGGDETSGESIFTEKMFVREENGISYVYVADENDRLKKQEVVVKNVDGYTIEIVSGLSLDDRITFPYGKNIKEGAPVKDGTIDQLYGY